MADAEDTQKSYNNSCRRTKYNEEKISTMVEGVFTLFDNDKSGCLKKTEFLKFLKRIIVDLGGEEPSMEQSEELMWQLDKNGDGQISRQQILVLFTSVIDIIGTMPERPHGVSRKNQNHNNRSNTKKLRLF